MLCYFRIILTILQWETTNHHDSDKVLTVHITFFSWAKSASNCESERKRPDYKKGFCVLLDTYFIFPHLGKPVLQGIISLSKTLFFQEFCGTLSSVR